MGIKRSEFFQYRAVFVNYPFESVMFRWDPTTNRVYRKFYGQSEDPEAIPSNNRLFNDALRFGEEITEAQYIAGQPSK